VAGRKAAARVETSPEEVVAWLKKTGTNATREGMLRYGIPNEKAFGVPVGVMRAEAKRLGRNHELALGLWEAGWYEARMMASFLDEPEKVTRKQMDEWAGDWDSWAICDKVCFHLFDQTAYGWEKARKWVGSTREFVKRGGFVMIAVLAGEGTEEDLEWSLEAIEERAGDERNFVWKGVNWALRMVGRRDARWNGEALKVCERLVRSGGKAEGLVGRDAQRELKSAKVQASLAKKRPA
jgi:3-methyladenine DNA glycosylase AlkD